MNGESKKSKRSLSGLQYSSFIAAAFNLLSSAAMLFLLNPALNPENSLEMRFHVLVAKQAEWVGSWILWIFAAVSLILFLVHWGSYLDRLTGGKWRPWIIFGTLIGCLGLIPDTIAETFYLSIFPKLAKQALSMMGEASTLSLRFREWENVAVHLTGFLGNGLYCIGGLTLQILTLKAKALPRFCRYFGFLVWLSGFGLSVAVIAENSVGMFTFTALTMGSFVFWSALIGLLPHPEPRA